MDVEAIFCHDVVDSVKEVVAKDDRSIFFSGKIKLNLILGICDMILGKKSYPILKYPKETGEDEQEKR